MDQSRIVAKATLIEHRMPSATGGTTPATTLLFVPKSKEPRGGWPVIVWAHGTTSVSASNCAPSQTPATLDGGLSGVGLPLYYPAFARKMIAAGYPVEFVSKVGADHGDVLVKGALEMLAFLRQRFA